MNNTRPLTPLVLNPVHRTSCWEVFAPTYELTADTEIEPTPRLPTPEERMRQQAEAVPADIVPINITGRTRLDWTRLSKSLKFKIHPGLEI